MIVQSKHIKKIYPNNKKALNNITFNVHKGEFISIMGPSGSGKTTLLNILGGIDQMTSGDLIINDIKINDMSSKERAKHRRETIGFVFQDFNFLESLTMKENIMLPLTFSDKSKKEIESKADQLIHDFKIGKIKNNYPVEVSGGEIQRAAVCRALISRPKIIFADEPTGNLDTRNSLNLLNIFQEVNKKYLTSIIMVTHDPMAACYSDRVLIIKDGELYNEIYKMDPKSKYLETITRAMQECGGDKQ